MCALVTGVQTFALPIFQNLLHHVDLAADAVDERQDEVEAGPQHHGEAAEALQRIFKALPDDGDGRPDKGDGEHRKDKREQIHEPSLPQSGQRRILRQHRPRAKPRSEEHTSELQSLMRISYAAFSLKKKKTKTTK